MLFDRAALEARALERDEETRDALANVVEQRLQRITQAIAFLRKPSTIRETAEAMGFSDVNTFHRAFRRWTGRTPTAYLRSNP